MIPIHINVCHPLTDLEGFMLNNPSGDTVFSYQGKHWSLHKKKYQGSEELISKLEFVVHMEICRLLTIENIEMEHVAQYFGNFT